MKKKIMMSSFILISIAVLVIGLKNRDPMESLRNEAGCEINTSFNVSDSEQLKDYLLSSVWINDWNDYTDQIIFIKITDDLFYSTEPFSLEEEETLGIHLLYNKRSLKTYKASEKCPTLFYDTYVNLIIDDFTVIEDDHFSIRTCVNACHSHEYEKREAAKVNFDGIYKYKGKTLIIEGEDLYHQEADKHYLIRQKDDHRLYVDGQIISEVPSYRFWIDEEGNLILFSDGMAVSYLSDKKILEEYPFYVLKKQK